MAAGWHSQSSWRSPGTPEDPVAVSLPSSRGRPGRGMILKRSRFTDVRCADSQTTDTSSAKVHLCNFLLSA
jgi:hypothetical protein